MGCHPDLRRCFIVLLIAALLTGYVYFLFAPEVRLDGSRLPRKGFVPTKHFPRPEPNISPGRNGKGTCTHHDSWSVQPSHMERDTPAVAMWEINIAFSYCPMTTLHLCCGLILRSHSGFTCGVGRLILLLLGQN